MSIDAVPISISISILLPIKGIEKTKKHSVAILSSPSMPLPSLSPKRKTQKPWIATANAAVIGKFSRILYFQYSVTTVVVVIIIDFDINPIIHKDVIDYLFSYIEALHRSIYDSVMELEYLVSFCQL
jgi:hypothetical protein